MKRIDALKVGSIAVQRSMLESLQLNTGIDWTRPSRIGAALTMRCNYKCGYCNHWRLEKYPNEMTLAEWQSALSSLKNFIGSYLIQFSGGEPFLWKNFLELVEFCYENDIRWGTITNGSALQKNNINRIIAAKPFNIDISIDSLRPEIHDTIRGKENSIENLLKNINFLLAERKRLSAQFILRVKTTVTRHNYPYLLEMVDWVNSKEGVFIDFSPVRYANGDKLGIKRLYPDSPAEFSAMDKVVQTLISRKNSGAPIETSVNKLESLVPHFQHQQVIHGYPECRVALRNYYIHSDGIVSNCWFFGSIGNVKHSSAEEIWKGALRKANIKPSISCNKVSSNECATACTSHRTLKQELQRGLTFLRKK